MKRSAAAAPPPQRCPLAALGYAYVPGPALSLAQPSDWVLRKLNDPTAAFSWDGQDHYDQLGAAAVGWVRGMLCSLCELEPVPVAGGGTIYCSPRLSEQTVVCLLVCGSAPGGDAGVWGRSLCINGSTADGAMFRYIFECRRRGWAVVVLDPHAGACPHVHLCEAWRAVDGMASSLARVLIVAHSYGAPLAVHLLKAEPLALARLAGLALTDGMAWTPDGWSGKDEHLLCEPTPLPDDQSRSASQRREWASFAPLAFQPPSASVRARLLEATCNFVASAAEVGSDLTSGHDIKRRSAGSEKHPSTTAAAEGAVFGFLEGCLSALADV